MTAVLRCSDCLGTDMLCTSCLLQGHEVTPLHRIEEWNGKFFEKKSLKDLGLRIQLGHPRGVKCYWPISAVKDDFVVIHTNGVHSVGLDFCGCELAEQTSQQLLRVRWFPASSDKPRTAASFAVLKQFHLLSFESKVSTYEYYNALMRMSDQVGKVERKERYEQFLRITREWRHLKMLKRAGRGHDNAGIEATQEGDCAVLCPACPQPGRNLVAGWSIAPPEKRWLYGLFVAIDANFRLKRKTVSSDAADPGLSRGWAYFVEELSYKSYLKDYLNEPQPKSSCAGHTAVNAADSKSTTGLAATAIGTVDCARHGFKLPCGVGDLQKGEKYVNMDYLVFSALRSFAPLQVLKVSYDIACQWHKHLWERMKRVPDMWHIDQTSKDITFLVPKFHLPAHITECQWLFSFNLVRGVGRTDGETPERAWASINPAASSTKEMGPGSQWDVIDDHFGDWNWKKLVTLGPMILRKIQEAIPERNEHREDFTELTESLSSKYPNLMSSWEQQVHEWEYDMTKPNPFEVKVAEVTMAGIRLQLAKDDAIAVSDSNQPPLHGMVTPSILIDTGIELEDQQRRLIVEAAKLGEHATDTQKAYLQQRANALKRRMDAWAKIQLLFIPGVASLRDMAEESSRIASSDLLQRPETFPLLLPSAIARRVACDQALEQMEWKFREGQAHDTLNELRQALRSQSYMLKFKDRFIRGQGANTRAQNCLKNVDAKVRATAAKYRAAHHALTVLSDLLGKVGWKHILRPLADEDIRSMTQGVDDSRSEGRRRLSWIWLVCGYSDSHVENEDDAGVQEAIRIEWCRTRTRAYCWTEEVDLLFEEQERILRFLCWHATWWRDKENAWTVNDPALQEGLRAYAERQATIRQDLKRTFEHMWRNMRQFLNIADEGLQGVDSVDILQH
ncbi:hypothetical protein L210DRAFT_3418879 [Boletus edulis BED1]|uniref:CxC2-like cysteine cluster KDZ transposase-associated domain-containing protein n=1 Tax=Boletus edulis BED1 TaxID=1328754 RepID=A0AAD4G988_BOLED|nr:hypothetical protein L210DRAFT_3418879 [Boletus edulis BED1]